MVTYTEEVFNEKLHFCAVGMAMRNGVFIEPSSLVDCQPRLKSDSSSQHEMKTILRQALNLYFKKDKGREQRLFLIDFDLNYRQAILFR